jgi:hypothetical protein
MESIALDEVFACHALVVFRDIRNVELFEIESRSWTLRVEPI